MCVRELTIQRVRATRPPPPVAPDDVNNKVARPTSTRNELAFANDLFTTSSNFPTNLHPRVRPSRKFARCARLLVKALALSRISGALKADMFTWTTPAIASNKTSATFITLEINCIVRADHFQRIARTIVAVSNALLGEINADIRARGVTQVPSSQAGKLGGILLRRAGSYLSYHFFSL